MSNSEHEKILLLWLKLVWVIQPEESAYGLHVLWTECSYSWYLLSNPYWPKPLKVWSTILRSREGWTEISWQWLASPSSFEPLLCCRLLLCTSADNMTNHYDSLFVILVQDLAILVKRQLCTDPLRSSITLQFNPRIINHKVTDITRKSQPACSLAIQWWPKNFAGIPWRCWLHHTHSQISY